MMRCECPKGTVLQSTYSPGLVSGAESIIFVLVDPLTSSQGSIKDFSNSKLKAGDLSICRSSHCTSTEADEKIVKPLINTPGRTYEGMVWTTCDDIRGIKLGESSEVAFCVHDDGLDDYNAHALMAYSVPKDDKLRNGNVRVAARGNLKEAFMRNGIHQNSSTCPFKAGA